MELYESLAIFCLLMILSPPKGVLRLVLPFWLNLPHRIGGNEIRLGFYFRRMCWTMKKRILVISHMYPNDVNPMAGIFVQNQTKALIEAGLDVHVVAPMPSFPLYPKWRGYRRLPERMVRDGIPVHYVPTRMFPGGLFFARYGNYYTYSLRKAIPSIQKEFPFDLIHCHTIYPDGYAGSKLKQEFKVPVISTIHGSDILLYPKRNKGVHARTLMALKQNDHVITVSDRLKKEALAMWPELSVSTVYNGFDPRRFFPVNKEEARRRLGLPEREKSILFVGNLLPVKGVHYLLQAFKQIVRDGNEARLYLIGDGPLRSELAKQAEELGIAAHVSFLGRKPYEEIPLWINSADVVTLTSLSEGLPSILLETMGCGRPMVATDVGGISEVLKHGETGLLVPPEDVSQIAISLKQILEDEALCKQMGERALEESKALTWERNAARIKECYKEVIERKSL
jgi:teichuronic acid biosynthesis glycosyltransferase TuaC